MDKKKIYWLIAGVVALGGLYLWSRKKQTQTETIDADINALNEQAAANNEEKKKLLDELYVLYAKNWSTSPDSTTVNYNYGYNQYKCALADFEKMSVEELKQTIAYHSTGTSIWDNDPLKYKLYADLSAKYPLAFDDHPCSQNTKPVVLDGSTATGLYGLGI